jgi:hypothetical protein
MSFRATIAARNSRMAAPSLRYPEIKRTPR